MMKNVLVAFFLASALAANAGSCWTVATGYNSIPAPIGLTVAANGDFIAYWAPTSVILAGTGCSGNPPANYGSNWAVSGTTTTPGGAAIFELLKVVKLNAKRINMQIDISQKGVLGATKIIDATITQ